MSGAIGVVQIADSSERWFDLQQQFQLCERCATPAQCDSRLLLPHADALGLAL